MHRFAAAAAGIALLAAGSTSFAQTVYPIDRAEILAGTTFDFKVEFPGLADLAKVTISINGEDYAKALGNTDSFIAREDVKDQSPCETVFAGHARLFLRRTAVGRMSGATPVPVAGFQPYSGW